MPQFLAEKESSLNIDRKSYVIGGVCATL